MKHRSDNDESWVSRSNPSTSAVIATVVIGTADYNSCLVKHAQTYCYNGSRFYLHCWVMRSGGVRCGHNSSVGVCVDPQVNVFALDRVRHDTPQIASFHPSSVYSSFSLSLSLSFLFNHGFSPPTLLSTTYSSNTLFTTYSDSLLVTWSLLYFPRQLAFASVYFAFNSNSAIQHHCVCQTVPTWKPIKSFLPL